ncbi:MAG: type II toxin-antitoxin system HicA family toxin [Candidatus Eremiobacteraeota bacterium]|nr:type II toxin-antitoxin system HicA family toxin [Candidatus Eremiobacteraeota bacterium]
MRARDVIAYAESRGWRFLRFGSRGSHRIYEHEEHSYTLSIPDHGSTDVPAGTLSKILKQIDGRWRRG